MKALLRTIVGPADSVPEEDRRQVLYLTVALLSFLVMGTLVLLTLPLVYLQDQTFARMFRDPFFYEALAAHLVLFAAYWLLRIGRVRIGKYLAILGVALFPIGTTVMPLLLPNAVPPITPDTYKGLLMALVFPVMFASAFLSLRETVVFFVLSVAYIVFIETVTPGIPIKTLVETLESVVPISVFQIILTWQKDHIAAERRKRLEALNEDLRRSEHEAQQAKEIAQEANKLKTEFLAVTSHELRTPLNSIIGFTDCLLHGIGVDAPPLVKDQRDMLERVATNSKRLLGNINDILDMSKREAKRVEVIHEMFSPRALLNKVMKEMESQAVMKRLTLNATVSPEMPAQILGDVHLVSRILINLIANAIKFTEEGQIEVHMQPADQNHWHLIVTDTGIGIPLDRLGAVFEPFQQADTSLKRVYGGTGLGLTIARDNARLMGGDIQIESQVGVGSTFTVTLPLVIYTSDELTDQTSNSQQLPAG